LSVENIETTALILKKCQFFWTRAFWHTIRIRESVCVKAHETDYLLTIKR